MKASEIGFKKDSDSRFDPFSADFEVSTHDGSNGRIDEAAKSIDDKISSSFVLMLIAVVMAAAAPSLLLRLFSAFPGFAYVFVLSIPLLTLFFAARGHMRSGAR